MKKLIALAMLISVLALSAPLALAADSGWYVGVGGGGSNFNGHAVDLEPSLASETYTVTRLDDTSAGWKLFAGKQLHENWAVEIAYNALGKFSYDANITSPTVTSEYGEAKPVCWSLSAIGILPLRNNFSLLGRAGVCRWDDRARAYEVGGPVYPPASIGTDMIVGFGAKYDVSNNLGVRAEWERYTKVVHRRNNVDLWSVSLQYGF